jgi:hypothetical protein
MKRISKNTPEQEKDELIKLLAQIASSSPLFQEYKKKLQERNSQLGNQRPDNTVPILDEDLYGSSENHEENLISRLTGEDLAEDEDLYGSSENPEENLITRLTGEHLAEIVLLLRSRSPFYERPSQSNFFKDKPKNEPSEDDKNITWLQKIYNTDNTDNTSALIEQYYPSFNDTLKDRITLYRTQEKNFFELLTTMNEHEMKIDKDALCLISMRVPAIPVCISGGYETYDLSSLLMQFKENPKNPVGNKPFEIANITVNRVVENILNTFIENLKKAESENKVVNKPSM